ncbi:hypothetical protein QBC42DRAFT_252674 [Cladorrhinum samala]|uniref:Uncharacterized protein n=1 Tax=Cladorrhinum samala TaxID=585594 RepID=A0AAV9HKE6_9PEZI|nr:hypothetical protein QBC42DRAFT_252674 [Cladorrhinum samala]
MNTAKERKDSRFALAFVKAARWTAATTEAITSTAAAITSAPAVITGHVALASYLPTIQTPSSFSSSSSSSSSKSLFTSAAADYLPQTLSSPIPIPTTLPPPLPTSWPDLTKITDSLARIPWSPRKTLPPGSSTMEMQFRSLAAATTAPQGIAHVDDVLAIQGDWHCYYDQDEGDYVGRLLEGDLMEEIEEAYGEVSCWRPGVEAGGEGGGGGGELGDEEGGVWAYCFDGRGISVRRVENYGLIDAMDGWFEGAREEERYKSVLKGLGSCVLEEDEEEEDGVGNCLARLYFRPWQVKLFRELAGMQLWTIFVAKIASAANRTRGPSMATMDFTTKPLTLGLVELVKAQPVIVLKISKWTKLENSR